ncbi:sensor histidine kinase [Paenibacillus sp. P46E]|uniref:cache domain-containing sensor histidine kinase n=1 Tax=Paenibacillus sp. P46E TaxID=1349436 RepID=UPI000939D5A0|nr:sensor histidine kinase [Paenibacillus sp. P46E]OKQ00315.1 two-component sensor histidine kinase [Paenibacillus sp. P46E]
MKWSFYKLSLKNRIQILYVLLTFLCISATGLFSYNFAADVIEENSLKLKQTLLNKSVQALDESMRHMIVSPYSMMMSETYGKVMSDVRNENTEHFYQNLSLLQTPFEQLRQVEPAVESALLVTPVGEFYATKDTVISRGRFNLLYQEELKDDSWNVHWVTGHEDTLFQGEKRVVSLILRPLRNTLNNYSLPGVYLMVNYKEDYIRNVIEQNLIDDQIRLFLLKRDGTPVIPTSYPALDEFKDAPFLKNIGDKDQGAFTYANREDEQLINFSALGVSKDWMLVSVQTKGDLLGPMRQIRWLILVIMIVCMVVALMFSSFLSKLLLKPLHKLYNLMLRVENNDLEVRFESKYEDEVGVIGLRFNRMLAQIENLIEEIKISEEEKLKFEIKALQAQINPHFLYNTLNTILWKSESGRSEQVGEMIVSLSLLFRLGLNNGHEITTLRQELDHAEQYMLLQQQCYDNLFTYSLQVPDDPGLLQAPVLKILLQPLVENSILHGFKDMDEPGHIIIEALRAGDSLELRVKDNGRGMDADKLNSQVKQQFEGHSSYALYNIFSRLQLNYGDRASLRFLSVPQVETMVVITIPLH